VSKVAAKQHPFGFNDCALARSPPLADRLPRGGKLREAVPVVADRAATAAEVLCPLCRSPLSPAELAQLLPAGTGSLAESLSRAALVNVAPHASAYCTACRDHVLQIGRFASGAAHADPASLLPGRVTAHAQVLHSLAQTVTSEPLTRPALRALIADCLLDDAD